MERTRAAARYAILDPTQPDKIKNMAIYNTPTPTDSTPRLLPALTSNMISISTADLGTPEGRVSVTISNYPISFVTPGLAGSFTARPSSVTYPSEAPWYRSTSESQARSIPAPLLIQLLPDNSVG